MTGCFVKRNSLSDLNENLFQQVVGMALGETCWNKVGNHKVVSQTEIPFVFKIIII